MIKHKIRAKDGGTKIVSLTAIKALRYHCIECVGFAASEVKNVQVLCVHYSLIGSVRFRDTKVMEISIILIKSDGICRGF